MSPYDGVEPARVAPSDRMRDRLNRIVARETGQPLERIEEDTRRNFWLDAEAAVRYGIVGHVVESVDQLDTPSGG